MNQQQKEGSLCPAEIKPRQEKEKPILINSQSRNVLTAGTDEIRSANKALCRHNLMIHIKNPSGERTNTAARDIL